MIKSYILVLSFLLFSGTLLAEKEDTFIFGVQGGVNFPRLNTTISGSNNSYTSKMSTGFNVGVLLSIPLMGELYLQPGLLFYQKGGLGESGESEMNTTINTMHIPINLVLNMDIGVTKPFVQAGVFVSYALNGSYYRTIGGQKSASQNLEFGSGKDMLAMDGGLTFGVGTEFMKVRFFINYDIGIVNLFPVANTEGSIKTNVLSFSLAYFFH